MSTFLELQDQIIEATSRIDKREPIKVQINSAVRLVSSSGKFWRDFNDVTIGALDGLDPAEYVQAITLPAQFRHPVYLNYPADISACPIEIVPIDTLIHPDYRNKTNIAYCSGNALHIKNATLTDTLDLGYYSYPASLVLDTDTNWITDYVPDLIIEMGIAFIKTITGDQTTASGISRLSGDKLMTYLQDVVQHATTGV